MTMTPEETSAEIMTVLDSTWQHIEAARTELKYAVALMRNPTLAAKFNAALSEMRTLQRSYMRLTFLWDLTAEGKMIAERYHKYIDLGAPLDAEASGPIDTEDENDGQTSQEG